MDLCYHTSRLRGYLTVGASQSGCTSSQAVHSAEYVITAARRAAELEAKYDRAIGLLKETRAREDKLETEVERLRDEVADANHAMLEQFDPAAARSTDLYTWIECQLGKLKRYDCGGGISGCRNITAQCMRCERDELRAQLAAYTEGRDCVEDPLADYCIACLPWMDTMQELWFEKEAGLYWFADTEDACVAQSEMAGVAWYPRPGSLPEAPAPKRHIESQHACPEWDGLVICRDDPEWDACICEDYGLNDKGQPASQPKDD